MPPSEVPLPEHPRLFPAYPNPFNPSTTLQFDAPDAAARVRLCVYDMLGREVALLYDGIPGPGRHSVGWSPTDLPAGVYFGRLTAQGSTFTTKPSTSKSSWWSSSISCEPCSTSASSEEKVRLRGATGSPARCAHSSSCAFTSFAAAEIARPMSVVVRLAPVEVGFEQWHRFRVGAPTIGQQVHYLRRRQLAEPLAAKTAGQHFARPFRCGTAFSMALKIVSTTVIGMVIHVRIAAGRTAVTTVPSLSFTLSGRRLPSLIG